MKTVEEATRAKIQAIYSEYLRDSQTLLEPKEILCREASDCDFTNVRFSFKDSTEKKDFKISVDGNGFVDCVFGACLEKYSKKYPSLKNLILVDYVVSPVFEPRQENKRLDARASICLKLKVKRNVIEFRDCSRSLIYSGFVVVLQAFEFYINCEKAFRLLRGLIVNARSRDRADLVSLYSYKLSNITEVNEYSPLES